jgi:polyisoprenoid-binding protein YceI
MEDAKTLTFYRIEPRSSRFTVQVTAGGLLSAFGHNPVIAVRDFSGEARLELDHLEASSVRLEVQASSLEVAGDVNEKDRREIEAIMHERVLESSTYPTIVFESSAVKATAAGPGQYRVEIAGTLSLHGVTSDQTIAARVMVSADRLRASGEFSLFQSNYGIELVTVAGGVLKVKDEIKVTLEVVASAVKATGSVAA